MRQSEQHSKQQHDSLLRFIHCPGGFTLFELLITTFLISLLLCGGAFSAKRFLRASQTERAGKEFLLLLQRMASDAAREQRDRTIVCDIGKNRFGEFINRNQSPQGMRIETLLNLPRGVKIKECVFGSLSKQKHVIILRKNGALTPGHVQLEDESGNQCTITQALRGGQRLDCV